MDFINKLVERYPLGQYTDKDWERDVFGEGAYSAGQYKTLKVGSFDAALAVSRANIKEVPESEIPEEHFIESLGISNGDDRVFSIKSTTKTWESTFLHEVGHIMMGHGNAEGLMVELGILPVEALEIEARLFAQVAMDKLGMDPGPEGWRLSLWLSEAHKIGAVSTELIRDVLARVEPKVDEFIALGQK
jgi:hypothetical protein